MAGYRLAPKAARARRYPAPRRRITFGVSVGNYTRTADDTLTVTDVAAVTALSTSLTATDSFTVTDEAVPSGIGAGSTAQGGLIWLFAPGSTATLIRTTTDGLTITDTASGSVSTASSYSRSATDTITLTDVAVVAYRAYSPGIATPTSLSSPQSSSSTLTSPQAGSSTLVPADRHPVTA